RPFPSYQKRTVNQSDLPPPTAPAQPSAPRRRAAPVNPDFLHWAGDVPDPDRFDTAPIQQAPQMRAPPASVPQMPGSGAAPPPRPDDMSRAVGPMTPGPPPPPPEPDLPSPRRPVWTSEPE